MSDLNVRTTLEAVDHASPIVTKFLAKVREFERVAKRLNASFSNIGGTGLQSMASLDRVTQNVTAQMRGLANVSKQASRNYASEWKRASDQRLNESRQMYSRLERMEREYQRTVSRIAAAERRSERNPGRGIGGRSFDTVGRIPAPRISTLVIGGATVGAGVASALKKRMETQAAEVRAQMFGDMSKNEVMALRKGFADRAGIKYGVGSAKVIDTAVEGLKAGVAKKFAGEFADLALKAQAGLDVNPQEVGKLLGRLATQMPWDTGRFSKILNAVAVSNNDTAADGNDIIQAMRRSLSALATTRMTPEQLAALDATQISLGTQPFKAGTFASFLTSQIAGADSARSQQASDLNAAANALGFGGRGGMAKAMRDRPMEAIQQILDRLATLPEKLRTKVAKQIGGREWMDELLTLVLGRDKLRDVVRDIESKPGFLDKTALQKIRSMAGRWASISAAFGLVWEKVGAGFGKIFDQVADAFIDNADRFDFDTISQHVSAFIEGLREGFGFRDWGEAVNSLAGIFDAGSIQKWKDFGRGLAEGFKEIAADFKIAFNALSFMSSGGNANAETMGKLAAEITGLAVALAVLAPVITTLAAFAGVIRGVANALGGRAILGGGPVGTAAMMAWLLARNNDTGLPSASIKQPGETTSQWRERQQKHRELQRYKPSGDPMFQPTAYYGRDLADNLNKFTGKVERAAFIGGSGSGGLQNALFIGGGGSGGGFSNSAGNGRGIRLNGTPLSHAVPGQRLPSFGVGSGGAIISRDKIPSFAGTGGSMADGLSRSAFERKFAGTALEGKYDAIVSAAKANNIPPALLAGIVAHETGNGHVLSGNNVAGLMDPATGSRRKMQFSDLDAGIRKAGEVAARNYRRAGGNLDKMGQTYAPVGAANDPRGLNSGWSSGVRRQMSAMAGASSGSAGTGDAVAWAEQYRGKNEYTDARLLASVLGGDVRGKSNAWCSRFVNHALAAVGGKGTGSNVANSYQRWGSAVNPSDVKRNDVILQTRGLGYNQPGGHVGLATGETRMVNGRLQMKMIAGNDGDAVREHWVDVDGNTMVRRGAPVTSQVPSASDVIQNVPAPRNPAGVSGGMQTMRDGGGPVHININGSSHDPEAIATLVQRRIDEAMNWRLHDTESQYT